MHIQMRYGIRHTFQRRHFFATYFTSIQAWLSSFSSLWMYARWLELELDFKTIHTVRIVRILPLLHTIIWIYKFVRFFLSVSLSVCAIIYFPLCTKHCTQWKLNMEFIGKYLSQNNCRNSSNHQRVQGIAIRNDCICLYVLFLQSFAFYLMNERAHAPLNRVLAINGKKILRDRDRNREMEKEMKTKTSQTLQPEMDL